MAERMLVVGAGGLGGITAALAAERWGTSAEPTFEVRALTTNARIAEAVRKGGYRVGGLLRERAIVAPILSEPAAVTGPYDWIVLAVQPPQVEEAARAAMPWLSPSGRLVCFQNGLAEERITRLGLPASRVVGAVVGWGASMPEPGRYHLTARGGFTVGTLDASAPEDALAGLASCLSPVAPVKLTTNLRGARWSKLAINCAISTLGTIGRGTLGAVLLHRTARRLGLELITEVVELASKEGVTLEKIAGLDLTKLALTDAERAAQGSPTLVAKHSLMLAVGARYRRMRSSMLSAIERGRIPAVDFLNGEIVERAERHRCAVPANREATQMVHDIARGRVPGGIGAIHLLQERIAKRRELERAR